MSLQINSVQPHRQGSSVALEFTGHLPSFSYSVTGHRVDVQGSRILIDFSVVKSGGVGAQALRRVSTSVDLGRRPEGSYQLVVTCNGDPCYDGQVKL